MKHPFGWAILACALLGSAPVRAEVYGTGPQGLSGMSCREFAAAGPRQQAMLLHIAMGLVHAGRSPFPAIDTDKVDGDSKEITALCAGDPATPFVIAVCSVAVAGGATRC
jgi:hypothetical protein